MPIKGDHNYATLVSVVCLSVVCNILAPFGNGSTLPAEILQNGRQGRVLALMVPNGIQEEGTVSEQWRLQWGTPFNVD